MNIAGAYPRMPLPAPLAPGPRFGNSRAFVQAQQQVDQVRQGVLADLDVLAKHLDAAFAAAGIPNVTCGVTLKNPYHGEQTLMLSVPYSTYGATKTQMVNVLKTIPGVTVNPALPLNVLIDTTYFSDDFTWDTSQTPALNGKLQALDLPVTGKFQYQDAHASGY